MLHMDVLALAADTGNFEPDFTWRISGFAERLKATFLEKLLKSREFEMESEDDFEWSGYPDVRARAKIHVKNGLAYLSLRLDKENRARVLALGPNPSVFYVLRDQSGSENPRHVSASQNQFSSRTFDHSRNYYETAIRSHCLTEPPYNVDDVVVIDVHVERPEVAQRAHSRDGSVDGLCDNYEKRKLMARNGLWWSYQSPYFYTKGPKGHRMQVHLALNGFEERGLTACLSFLRGEFDDDLPSTFVHKTTITLFNRKDPSRNVTKTVEKVIDRGGCTYIEVGSYGELESVIMDDTLAYNVTVQPQLFKEPNVEEDHCQIL